MNTNKIFGVLISSMLAIMLAGCNLPTSQNTNDTKIATAAYQTVQAAISQNTSAPQAIMNSPEPNATPLASPVASPIASPLPTFTLTPTASKATLIINENSNCRSGPSQTFKVITAFTPGTALDIIGQDSANNFWLVNIPNSTDTCWVWGQYATPGGDYKNIPEVTPEAIAQNQTPNQPGSLYYTYSCSFGSLTTTLKWKDSSDNENGFHVYRDGTQIADLPANSSTYTDNTAIAVGASVTYAVDAYNNAGISPQRTVTFQCQ